MHKKRFYQFSALVIFAFGILFVINSQANITGAVIGYGVVFPEIEFFVGSIFIVFAGILLVVGGGVGGLEVLISEKALERARKDPRIKNNIEKYVDEIKMIMSDPRQRPQEILGKFHVSPRGKGKGGIRVAWHLDGNILYVDDLLYHERGNQYVDNWARKAGKKKVVISDYAESGYVDYKGRI